MKKRQPFFTSASLPDTFKCLCELEETSQFSSKVYKFNLYYNIETEEYIFTYDDRVGKKFRWIYAHDNRANATTLYIEWYIEKYKTAYINWVKQNATHQDGFLDNVIEDEYYDDESDQVAQPKVISDKSEAMVQHLINEFGSREQLVMYIINES